METAITVGTYVTINNERNLLRFVESSDGSVNINGLSCRGIEIDLGIDLTTSTVLPKYVSIQ